MAILFSRSPSPAGVRPRSFMGLLAGGSCHINASGKGSKQRSNNLRGFGTKRLPSLSRLLKQGEFGTIFQLLKDPNSKIERWFDVEYNIMGANALHLVMQYAPPGRLVTAMIVRLQESGLSLQPELTVDLRGRTPLHYACEAQCEPAVIHALLETRAGAISARSKDLEGRLPLHLLCRGYNLPRIRRSKTASQQRISALSAMITSIKLLVGLSPRTACVTDNKLRTALDYIQNLKMEQENETCHELWEVMKLELSIAMDLSSSTVTHQNAHQAGMVIKFHSEYTENDDVSVLSCPGVMYRLKVRIGWRLLASLFRLRLFLVQPSAPPPSV